MHDAKPALFTIVVALLLVACGGTQEPTQLELREVTRVVTDVGEREVTRVVGEQEEGDVTRAAESQSEVIELPPVDPLLVKGDIVTAGSSTVFPLTEAVAAHFEDEGYGGQITIDSIGSGAGFERFCVAGESDISNASRPIRESEVESCRAIGREPIEFRVGTDALAVTVSGENDFVQDVTLEEVTLLFSTAETWSDVRSEWPDEPILRYIPGTDSGTFDYFVEVVFDENEEPILRASNVELSEDDNVLVQGLLGSPYAIAFFGYAFYQENENQLEVLSINDTQASAETVESGDYPLARPLLIYSDAQIMQQKPQVAGFMNYYLSSVNEVIDDVGYFPASTTALNEARQMWLEATGQQ
jgi:phosphate transport system substrate-binding protein